MASLDHDTATAQLLAAANWPTFLHCWSLRKSLLLNHPNPTCNLTDWVSCPIITKPFSSSSIPHQNSNSTQPHAKYHDTKVEWNAKTVLHADWLHTAPRPECGACTLPSPHPTAPQNLSCRLCLIPDLSGSTSKDRAFQSAGMDPSANCNSHPASLCRSIFPMHLSRQISTPSPHLVLNHPFFYPYRVMLSKPHLNPLPDKSGGCPSHLSMYLRAVHG